MKFRKTRADTTPSNEGDLCQYLTGDLAGVTRSRPPRIWIYWKSWTDVRLHALDDHCDALAAADARRCQSIAAVAPAQLVEQRQNQPRAGRSQRVTERD